MRLAWRLLIGACMLTAYFLAAGVVARVPAARAQSGCTELLLDGGFEEHDVWELGPTLLMPEYETYTKHSGDYALALGITKGGNALSYSSARQTVTIPATATRVTLSFWVYAMAEGAPTTDYMELALLSPSNVVWDKPWYSRTDSRVWNQMTFDLTAWRGETLQIYFNVYNDGLGGAAGMFLDDVTLTACSTPTATVTPSLQPTLTPTGTMTVTSTNTAIWIGTPSPSPTSSGTPTVTPLASPTRTRTAMPSPTLTPVDTPTPTATSWGTRTPTRTPHGTSTRTRTPDSAQTRTPTPTLTRSLVWADTGTPRYCVQLIANSDFEDDLTSWQPAPVALQVMGVSDPVHGGDWALRLGSQDQNIRSHSSVRQYVAIPSEATSVTLEFWAYTWSQPDIGSDYQEMALRSPQGDLIHPLWRDASNDRRWVWHAIPLAAYAGREIGIYFNVYNDGYGGVTAMFLDDVRLTACAPQAFSSVPGHGIDEVVVSPDPTSTEPPVTFVTPTAQRTRVALALTAQPTWTLVPTPTPQATATPALAQNWFSRMFRRVFEGRPTGGFCVLSALVAVIALLVGWFFGVGRGGKP